MNDNIENTENLSRREREKAQHRRDIMDAAIKVFAEKGYHVATLDEVAQEAEFSKGALYLYFSNKEDILFSILNEVSERLEQLAVTTITGEKSLREEITLLYKSVSDEVFKRTDIFNVIAAQHAIFFRNVCDDKQKSLIKKHRQFWIDFGERVQQAIDDGEVRDLPVKGIVGVIHGALDSLVQSRWDCDSMDDMRIAIDLFIEILFNGIGNKKEEA